MLCAAVVRCGSSGSAAAGTRCLAIPAAKPKIIEKPIKKKRANTTGNEEALAEPDAPPRELGAFRRLRIWQLTETGDDPSVHRQKHTPGQVSEWEQSFRETHRWKRQSTEQDWPSVWPTAQTFKPATVPLPIRMGYRENPMKKGPPPDKYWNKELMKIPNFLHLTPPAVDRHCDAMKQFCTAWPAGLDSSSAIHTHYPLTVTTVDRVHSGPSLRDHRSHHVRIQMHLDSLPLHDTHAKEKFIRLVGAERYDKRSGLVTIESDRCPTRQQNWDYLQYLLTVLCGESNETESWESDMRREDSLSHVFAQSDGCGRWLRWSRDWLAQPTEQRPNWLRGFEPDVGDAELLQAPEMQRLKSAWQRATNADDTATDVELIELWQDVNEQSVALLGLQPYDDRR